MIMSVSSQRQPARMEDSVKHYTVALSMIAAEYAAHSVRLGQTCARHAQYNKPLRSMYHKINRA